MKRRFQFTVTYSIDVNDIGTDDKKELARRVPYLSGDEEFLEEVVGRQRRLLEALQARPDMLEEYVKAILPGEIQLDEGGGVEGLLQPLSDPDEIVDRIIPELSLDDQKFWAMVKEDGLFSENAEYFYNAFQFSVRNITLNTH